MWNPRRRKPGKFRKTLFIVIIILLLITSGFFAFYYYTFLSKKVISPVPIASRNDHLLAEVKAPPMEKIKLLLKDKRIVFSSISISSDSAYLVLLPHGEEIFFSSKKDLPSQVSSLHLILTRLTIEGKEFRRLDLRFDKPIIVFK